MRRSATARFRSKMYVGSLYRRCLRILTRMRRLLGTPMRMKHKVMAELTSEVSLAALQYSWDTELELRPTKLKVEHE